MAKREIRKLGIVLLLFLSLLTAANAYTTNGTDKTFSFAVTSGANYYTEGGDFSTWVVVGDISNTLNSSNFRTELGFLRTAGYIIGESCDIDNDCPGGSCCSSKCQSSCTSEPSATPASSQPTPSTSSGGSGRTEIPEPILKDSYSRFFDSVKSNQEVNLVVSRSDLPITEIKFIANQDIDGITLSLSPVNSPQYSISNAYSYFEITSDKLNQDNLAAFIVKFKVRADSGYIKDTISLNMYSSNWVELPTALIGEDSQYYYYESNVREFSLFAIAGQKASSLIGEKEPEIEAPEAAEEEKIAEAAKGAAEEKVKDDLQKLNIYAISGFAIVVLLIYLALLLVYVYPKLRYTHFKNLNSKFNNLLHKARYYANKNKPAEAKEAYRQLVSDYEQLEKYQTDRQFWFHIKSLVSIYKKIAWIAKQNLKGNAIQKEFRRRVHDYIKENLEKGHSLKSIKESFIRHGYQKKFASSLVYRYRAKNFIIKIGPLFVVPALLILSAVFFYKPDATTFATITKGYNFTDNIGLTFNESSEYLWIPENKGILKSVSLSGELKESGDVKIHLKHENHSYLVFSRELMEKTGIEGITGFAIKDGGVLITLKDNLTGKEQAIINTLVEDINKTGNDVLIDIEVSEDVKKEISGSITPLQESLIDELISSLDSRIDDKKDRLQLKIESKFEEIEIPGYAGNLTLINETPINQTINQSNAGIEVNETINMTPTINETILNETVNMTIPLNETSLTNETINISTKNIEVVLEYKKGTLYDEDDNGVENINSIADLTVENSKFSWDADKENLCTRWNVYPVDSQQSTMVCYGSGRCCEFAGLLPKRDKWNEAYYASYGKDGADLRNIVSAQLLYVDYNLSISGPYVDIHYSEWKNLTVEFYEEFTKFSSVCAETCILPDLNGTGYELVIEILNSSLILSSISYQILRPEIMNTGPILLKNFSDMLIYKGQSLAINLSEYFYDEGNDTLIFSYYNSDLDVLIVNSTAVLSTGNFTGATHMFFTANDSADTALSNIFKVEIKEPEVKERKEISNTLKSLRNLIGI